MHLSIYGVTVILVGLWIITQFPMQNRLFADIFKLQILKSRKKGKYSHFLFSDQFEIDLHNRVIELHERLYLNELIIDST